MLPACRGFRSAVTLAVNFNRMKQSQKKMTCLAALSLSKLTQKKNPSFLNEIISPINKFDLSGITVISANQIALFSTESLEDVTEELTEVSEDDSESVRTKWPSPMLNGDKTYRKRWGVSNQLFIGGKNFNHNEEHLKNLFSIFGKVNDVMVPNRNAYNSEKTKDGEFRWGFISFDSSTSYENALNAGSIEDGSDIIVVRKRNERQSIKDEYKRTLIISDLPFDVTVDSLRNQFESFGVIKLINLIYNAASNSNFDGKMNLAFIVYENEKEVLRAIDAMSPTMLVKKSGIQRRDQSRHRCVKLFVHGIPESERNDKSIMKHFPTAKNSYLVLDKVSDTPSDTAIIEFSSQEDAHNAAKEAVEMAGQKVLVKALGWSPSNVEQSDQ